MGNEKLKLMLRRLSIAVDGDRLTAIASTAKAIVDATPTTIVGRMADVIDSTVAQ